MGLAPAIALVLLPKCPMCLAGYLAITGWLGESRLFALRWLVFLVLLLLTMGVARLTVYTWNRRHYDMAFLVPLSTVTLFLGKFWFESAWVASAGAVLLVILAWRSGAAVGGRATDRPS